MAKTKAKIPKTEYVVDVSVVVTMSRQITVEAVSEEEAKEQALKTIREDGDLIEFEPDTPVDEMPDDDFFLTASGPDDELSTEEEELEAQANPYLSHGTCPEVDCG